MNISVIGLGKLGLPLAATLAKHGHHVIGVDVDLDIIDAVNEKKIESLEPYLKEYVKSAKHLEATKKYEYAVENSDLTFIMVSTLTKKGKTYDVKALTNTLNTLKKNLQTKKNKNIVVVVSTVLMGDMRNFVAPIFKEMNISILYNPIFPAIGTVIQNLENPDIIIIGGEDQTAMAKLNEVWMSLGANVGKTHYMSWENAELVKLALNFYCCMKISFTNILTELCEYVEGGNINEVTKAIGMDTRIGPKFLIGGLGYGGPCFPKDDLAFEHVLWKYEMDSFLPSAIYKINHHQVTRVIQKVLRELGGTKGGKVAVLGVTYKPGVKSIEESQAWELVCGLEDLGVEVDKYDPSYFPPRIFPIALKNAKVVVVATPWPEFKQLQDTTFPEGCTIIDCWRILKHLQNSKRVKYIGFGLN